MVRVGAWESNDKGKAEYKRSYWIKKNDRRESGKEDKHRRKRSETKIKAVVPENTVKNCNNKLLKTVYNTYKLMYVCVCVCVSVWAYIFSYLG